MSLLLATDIAKAFAGVRVLEGVQFELLAGEVHTLMGENGAGKSTLMKILAGVHRPDAGTLSLEGSPITLSGPRDATTHGIALIHQEPLNFPDLSIAENIFLGRGTTPRGKLGQIDWRAMHREARRWLAELGVTTLDVCRPMRGLSIADQQMVELAAALSQRAKVMLLDEPTAALTPGEAANLFAIVRRLRSQGVGIVFISHRLPEVFEISDRITVLRDGRFVGTKRTSETDTDEIVQMMVGRPLSTLYDKQISTPGEIVLRVEGLSRRGEFREVSLDVRAGEIVGLAGLVGAGRTQVAQAIFGITRADAGTVCIDGKRVRVTHPRDAVKHGIAYVPEDRAQHGLLLPMSIKDNTTLASLPAVASLGFLSHTREREMAERWRGTLRTRLRDVGQPVAELSGGNQQKVVLAKWLETKPRLLIVDEPTRGIDIGAKAEVHHVLAELAKQGTAILMISSDLPEVLAMSDRVLVMREGQLVGAFSRGEATQESIMRAATLGESRGEGSNSITAEGVHQTQRPKERRRLNIPRELSVVVFLVLAFVVLTVIDRRFVATDTLRSILMGMPLILIVAMGQFLAILSRNIDLSVGSMLGLSAIVACGAYASFPAMPVPVAFMLAIGVGGLLGCANGALIALLRVPAIIATLGTMTAYRGIAFIWSGGRQVDGDRLPPALRALAQDGIIGIAWFVWIALLVTVLTAVFLTFTTTGRNLYAIGSNPRAAELRGLPVKRSILLLFTLSGACAGLAAILFGARFGAINPGSAGSAPPMELVTISAVVLGGVAVNGGAGRVLGVVLGCLLLAMFVPATSLLSISPFWEGVVYGAAILFAVVLDAALRRRAR